MRGLNTKERMEAIKTAFSEPEIKKTEALAYAIQIIRYEYNRMQRDRYHRRGQKIAKWVKIQQEVFNARLEMANR